MIRTIYLFTFLAFAFLTAEGGEIRREFSIGNGQTVEIINRFGRIDVRAVEPAESTSAGLTAESRDGVSENEVKLANSRGIIRITVAPAIHGKRIDLILTLPERSRVKAITESGEIKLQGNFESAAADTGTGTIAVDVPADDLKYSLKWLASRPRVLADFELERIRERTGGKFEISGNYTEGGGSLDKNDASGRVTLNLATQRGIMLINVPPNEVSPDLRERPLTKAAKAIARSGDSVFVEAIRRASPKHFGEYLTSLPPYSRPPEFSERTVRPPAVNAEIKKAVVRVTDAENRAVLGITKDDLEILEDGRGREILSVKQIYEPVNLVLLLDVSGSVENYVNFIRKAARSFIQTMDDKDRIAIITFNDEVAELAGFSTDKNKLSESLDSFDAGGGTAYYDAVAYTLVETLRPLRDERIALVILTDGDDNRSFMPFEPLLNSLSETDILIYPLYVPSALVAISESRQIDPALDPLRSRHLGLSARAQDEGARLAKASGGTYYPISQLSQIQQAYNDIVEQLRTTYEVTYRSELDTADEKVISSRLRVGVKKPNVFVNIISLSIGNR